MRCTFLIGLAPCLTAAVLLAAPREARAGVYLGAEFDAGTLFSPPSGAKNGWGFAGTAGYRFGLGPVFLQPEAMVQYLVFPFEGADALHTTRILGGGRFGLGSMVQPQIFGHAGVGWLGSGLDGPAFDVGFALGFKLIPLLRFGAQVGYNVVTIKSADVSAKWIEYGVHAGVEI
jgi:hypothetical protein